ncbi:hypothetical protein UFOVP153_60 [uncultured Caudovirales phage]|uniref:Uncharacterized protein n=1 Tax=uncultured Caudovirales phage TaxID=2100421 RepID=A0A6J7WD09_9CAUD|nr:hypothetical protein UFOVP69_63 [uncultured Caudovirales phage]CAB5171087.1 hypothetical protein UFOVP153_60 [uncultured Caudovirales phage]
MNYKCHSGQSFSDVCLNTYGTLDKYVKMLEDNNCTPDTAPYSNEAITWDNNLVADQSVLTKIVNANITFATSFGLNNNNYFQVLGTENPTVMAVNPEPINPPGGTSMYIKPLSLDYTASGGETVITIVELQGMNVQQIEREIKPLKKSEFIFDQLTGTITLVGVDPLGEGEILFILYTQTVTL